MDKGSNVSVATLGRSAWALYDWANSAFSTIVVTFVFAAYFIREVAQDEVSGSTLWGWTVGAAGFVVAAAGPVLGAVADQVGGTKVWVAASTLFCVAFTGLMWFVEPSTADLWTALLLLGLSKVGADLAMIFYNAMLPRIAGPENIGRWSGWAWGTGYAGGLSCLAAALWIMSAGVSFGMELDRASSEHIRVTFPPLAAAWYLAFSLPFFLLTPETSPKGKPFLQGVKAGMEQIRDSIRHIRSYVRIVRFLVARMVYIEGVNTLFVFGGLFAAGSFAMSEQDVLLFGIAINASAGLGAVLFAWVDDWIGGERTILLALTGLMLFGSLALFAPSIRLFWLFAMPLGLFVGPIHAASRSVMSRMVPESLRHQVFGLYAFSGKVTAFIGPLLVSWTTRWSGSQRLGLTPVLGLFIVGFLMMHRLGAARQGSAR